MRVSLPVIVVAFAVAALPAAAQKPSGNEYKVEIAKDDTGQEHIYKVRQGPQNTLKITVRFKITRSSDGALVANLTEETKDAIRVEENGRPVRGFEIDRPQTAELTAILALDISGSMAESNKIHEAKAAANLFLDLLNARADCGLILFDHEMRVKEPPVGEPREEGLLRQKRERLREHIHAAKPLGGTAYLDATANAIRMLKGLRGRKAVLVMTDGVDLNSQSNLEEVIKLAIVNDVPVYTLGVGQPGKNEPVTTVLVLDHSGSMSAPADDVDKISKIKALHRAAARFIELIRVGARTTLLPFSSRVETPRAFSADKEDLKRKVDQLQPEGGTLLYDATYAAIETLEAARPEGKRAVVVMTDGVDEAPGSRHSYQEVIDRAKEAGIPLHMLGLGRENELNKEVMQQMARETGGTFHHARNQRDLFEIFESLSIQLHDDGIDENSLKALAEKTGGKYYPARDVSKLQLIYKELAEELQTTYTVTFPSLNQTDDGTARNISVSVVRDGHLLSEAASTSYQVHGVVVPVMDAGWYLTFLAILGGLVVLPLGLRRWSRLNGGT